MTPPTRITFTRHDPASALDILGVVIVPVYEASHADVIGNLFYWSWRTTTHLIATAFCLWGLMELAKTWAVAKGYALATDPRLWAPFTVAAATAGAVWRARRRRAGRRGNSPGSGN